MMLSCFLAAVLAGRWAGVRLCDHHKSYIPIRPSKGKGCGLVTARRDVFASCLWNDLHTI